MSAVARNGLKRSAQRKSNKKKDGHKEQSCAKLTLYPKTERIRMGTMYHVKAESLRPHVLNGSTEFQASHIYLGGAENLFDLIVGREPNAVVSLFDGTHLIRFHDGMALRPH